MTAAKPAGSTAVMNRRAATAPDELNYFPTPPWAVRGFIELVLHQIFRPSSLLTVKAHECCAGEGHMAETMRPYFKEVIATDVFDYGVGYPTQDILDREVRLSAGVELVMSNPPFNTALEIVLRLLDDKVPAIAMLCRSNWGDESEERYENLFLKKPYAIRAPYIERVPMVKGRYDHEARSATSYSWFIWLRDYKPKRPEVLFIPPHRARLETPDDIRRWCEPAEAPLLEGALS